MAERVGAYTPETARSIAEFVRGARRRAPRPRVDWHEVGVPQDRVIRWARTTTNYEYPTYPSSGGVYVVEMGDYEPDTLVPGDTPDKTFTPYSYPPWTEIAVDPSGATIAQGTVVRVELHDGQWWIRPTAAAGSSWPLVRMYGNGWKSQYSDTSYCLKNYPADCKFYYYNGDATACGITPTGDASSAYGDPTLTFTAAGGQYLILPHIAGTTHETSLSIPYTQTVTTSAASAGTAHTHTVDCPINQFSHLALVVYKRASGAGSWTIHASAVGSTAVMGNNIFNGASSGSSTISAPIHVRSIAAGDELLLRCLAFTTAATGTQYFLADRVEFSIIRVLEDDTQNTVT